MLKSLPGDEVGWYVIKYTEKPFGLYRISLRDQPTSYSDELFKMLFISKMICDKALTEI